MLGCASKSIEAGIWDIFGVEKKPFIPVNSTFPLTQPPTPVNKQHSPEKPVKVLESSQEESFEETGVKEECSCYLNFYFFWALVVTSFTSILFLGLYCNQKQSNVKSYAKKYTARCNKHVSALDA